MTNLLSSFRIRSLATLLLVGIASVLHAQSFTTFDVPGSAYTSPSAINPKGQVTGYYVDASNAFHGFLRDHDGSLTTFDVPGSISTAATSVNPWGQTTGYYVDSSNAFHGFFRDCDGSFTTFDVPDSTDESEQWHTTATSGTAINPAGQITGYYAQSTVPPGETRVQVFLRSTDGTLTTFGMGSGVDMRPAAINPAGQIVGSLYNYDPPGPTSAFLRNTDNTQSIFSDDSASTEYTDISSAGRIVGWGRTLGGFMKRPDGTVTQFGVTGSVLTFPNAINAAGRIAGYYIDSYNSVQGFVRERDGTLTTFTVPTSIYTYPAAMSQTGEITGYYQDASGVHGFIRDN